MTLNVAALVAAAGCSSRMGRFKPLLPLGGKSIIEHVVDKLHEGGAETVVVVTGHNRHLLAPVVEKCGAVTIHNPDYQTTGMYDSLKLGLRYLRNKCDAFFIQPGDMPLITVETLRSQIEALITTGSQVVHPSYMGRKHGHPVLFAGNAIDALLAHDGEGGLRTAIRKLFGGKTDISVLDQGILIDADRPEDYQALVARFNKTAIPMELMEWPFLAQA
ncbi:MAG: nucleotidyltransferase family protein [Planctomycetes bacterium]|nr:nucleotidyltransferase family protein [Planctomycetota bacterium]